MEETLDKKTISKTVSLDPKEIDFFVERFAQILLMQLKYENEYEEKTGRLSKTL